MTQYPTDKHSCVLADLPWAFATWSHKGKGRSAEAFYDVMDLRAIKALPVGDWAASNCVLLLWITSPSLPQGLEVITAWGFTYKTVGFCWVKSLKNGAGFAIGLGHWSRANVELCLLATRGNPHRLNADVRQLIVAPRREHSRKPDEIYERIEKLAVGPYLELFASATTPHRDGWTRWVGKDRAPERRWKSSGYPQIAETEREP
jgi:N6-adenosine-specific RNA methylase IME4